MLKIAIAQIKSVSDCYKNLALCKAVARRAAEAHAEIVFFPECADIVFGPDYDKEAEVKNPKNVDAYLEGMRSTAKELGIYISLGAHTKDPNDDSKWMNSALTYSPQGELIHKYDKLHPCVVSLGDGMEVDERGSCSSGSPSQKGLQPLEVKAKSGETWKIGIAICYDIRFPQFATYHRNNGCHAIVYATAWFPYTRTHWDPLLSARAIDSQAYIIAPVQYGDHDEERSSLGAGAILDPWGNKMVSLPALHHDVPAKGDGLLSALATKNEQSVYCSTGGSSEKLEDFEDCWIGYGVLKMEEVTALRKDLPVWDFLRNDVY